MARYNTQYNMLKLGEGIWYVLNKYIFKLYTWFIFKKNLRKISRYYWLGKNFYFHTKSFTWDKTIHFIFNHIIQILGWREKPCPSILCKPKPSDTTFAGKLC